jgi:hypothetical protein
MEQGQPQSVVTFQRALVLFEMTEGDLRASDAQNRLDEQRRKLLLTWHPPRYATLTNNPKKYMKMYKQGEAMTKEIQAAYELLVDMLQNSAPGKQSDAP